MIDFDTNPPSWADTGHPVINDVLKGVESGLLVHAPAKYSQRMDQYVSSKQPGQTVSLHGFYEYLKTVEPFYRTLSLEAAKSAWNRKIKSYPVKLLKKAHKSKKNGTSNIYIIK